MAQSLGARDDLSVHRIVHTTIPTALITGLFLTGIGVLFSEDFLIMMDTPVSVLPHAAKYMRITFFGMIFSMVYNFVASILRAAGDTKSPLIFLIISGFLNVVLNTIFVIVFHMDVDGVALATVISQAISALLVVGSLMRRNDSCHFSISQMHIYKKQLLEIMRIGLPAGFQGSLFSICNVILQSSINSFQSDAIISGNGASANIEGFVYMIMNSFHQASVNFTGQNAGAHRYDRVKKVFFTCLGLVAVSGFAAGFITWLMGDVLLRIYITDSPEAIQWGFIRLTFICLPYFLNGMQDVTIGSVRGLGASIVPTLFSILSICGVRILWIYTIFQIPQYHTLQCLYLSYPISWTATILSQAAIFAFLYQKQSRAILLKTSNEITGG